MALCLCIEFPMTALVKILLRGQKGGHFLYFLVFVTLTPYKILVGKPDTTEQENDKSIEMNIYSEEKFTFLSDKEGDDKIIVEAK